MGEVIVVNGPPGVGKSTVTACLRRYVPSTVAISGDELRAFAPEDARAHLGGGATYRAAGALVASYLSLGAERVIFDYVFSRRAHFAYFREALPAGVEPRVFTLWAPLRAAPEREMAQNLEQMAQIIDTEGLTAEVVAERIHELVSSRSTS